MFMNKPLLILVPKYLPSVPKWKNHNKYCLLCPMDNNVIYAATISKLVFHYINPPGYRQLSEIKGKMSGYWGLHINVKF